MESGNEKREGRDLAVICENDVPRSAGFSSAAEFDEPESFERRQSYRYPLRLHMRITRVNDSQVDIVAQTCNVSLSGASFSCTAELGLGAKLKYALELPSRFGAWLVCHGEVVRCEAQADNHAARLAYKFAVTLISYEFRRTSRMFGS